MPGLSGSELVSSLIAARATNALPPETLLLGMSGSAPSQVETDLFDRFLQKPFTVEDVAKAIEQARAGSTRKTSAAPAAEAGPSTLPPLDERTFSQLRSKLPDDQLRQLYAMTLDDVQQRLERMSAVAQQGDHAAVRREAHTIKGCCGMVGAFELQQLAAATEGGSALDTSALADFSRACQRLQRMLDERL
jgi:HPt (histidine-containing phosphotransfer) domain-containing protein